MTSISTGTRVCICLPEPVGPMFDEVAGMLRGSLQAEGFQVRVTTAAQKLPRSDVVILFGDAARLEPVMKQLGPLPNRPITQLWQLDALPPETFDPTKVERAYRAALGDGRRRDPDGLGRAALSRLLTTPLKRAIRRTAVNILGSRSRRLTKQLWPSDPVSRRRALRLVHVRDWVEWGWLDCVSVSLPERVRVLAAWGVPASWVPVGYHPDMGTDLEHERDLAAVFLGRETPWRKSVLAVAEEQLRAAGLTLHIGRRCYGDDRSALLNRAKTNLLIAPFPDFQEFARIRMMLSAACGTLVVADPAGDSAPFEPGVHFVEAPARELGQAIRHYAENESERVSIVQAARSLVFEKMTMTHSARAMIRMWKAALSARAVSS